MMANVPAWRAIDPLIVLSYSKDEDDDDESLLDIIDGNESQDESVFHSSSGIGLKRFFGTS